MDIGNKLRFLIESSTEYNMLSFALAIGHTEQSLFGILKKKDINTKQSARVVLPQPKPFIYNGFRL